MEQKKKIKIAITVLAVLLGLSLLALGGTLLYNKFAENTPASATVPDNLITPDKGTDNPGGSNSNPDNGSGTQTSGSSDGVNSAAQSTEGTAAETKKATAIELYSKQPEENIPFKADNMFPGDSETKYFRVRVSYHDKVTVHYKAAVRPGYEKLAEVMKVKVKLLTTGETMYDGLMKDMPESLTHKLESQKSTSDELYYEITAYLDTSVGNEYQDKDLIADFKWWVEETGNLDNSPRTGDNSNIMPWALTAAVSSSVMLLLLVVRKRKEEKGND